MNSRVLFTIAAIVTVLVGAGVFITAQLAGDSNQTSASNANRFSTTDRLIRSLEDQIRSDPKNADTQLKLANAYLQKVRETADTSYYDKVDRAVDAAAQSEPDNPQVPATRAAVAYGRHDFVKGLKLAQEAVALSPRQASYHGLVGDGHIELGNYPETVGAYQAMVNLRPDLGAFNRISHIREIYGDIEGAKAALNSAISASSSFPENVAFSQVELGKLQLHSNVDEAEATFRQALASVADYEPALQGLGRVAVARGNHEQAIKYFKQAFEALPIAQYATDLGDVYTVQGDTKKAGQQYQLAKLAYQSSAADGINTDQEMALFLADHTDEYTSALTKAQAAYQARPNIYAADTLAWAHYKKGNNSEAKKYALEALRLGEHDPLILFHAGMIAAKNDDTSDAKRYLTKALELHPNFSIVQAPVAKKALQKL